METVGSLFPDSDGSATEQKEVASAATQAEQNLQEKDSRPSTGYVVDAPLSPPRPVFRDILFTSLAAEEAGVELIGMTVQMDLPELGLTGEAIVTDIQACSEIEPRVGDGDDRRVVTATFHHSSGDVIDLVLADECSDLNPETQTLKPVGEADAIGTTSNHPFWSLDRQEYVQAGQLQVGERLQTLHGGTKTVVSNLPRPGPNSDVYNLEVHAEHVYFVGTDGVLVHNSKAYTGSRIKKNEAGHWVALTGTGKNAKWRRVRSLSDGQHGNARASAVAQEGYVVIDRRNGTCMKVGVVEAAKGATNRLAEQATNIVRLARENGYSISARHLDVVSVKKIGAGAGARGKIYDWERRFSGFLLNSGNQLPGHKAPRVPFWRS